MSSITYDIINTINKDSEIDILNKKLKLVKIVEVLYTNQMVYWRDVKDIVMLNGEIIVRIKNTLYKIYDRDIGKDKSITKEITKPSLLKKYLEIVVSDGSTNAQYDTFVAGDVSRYIYENEKERKLCLTKARCDFQMLDEKVYNKFKSDVMGQLIYETFGVSDFRMIDKYKKQNMYVGLWEYEDILQDARHNNLNK